MRIIHSDDWQIGKVFKQFGAKEEMLRQARFDSAQKSRYQHSYDLPTRIPTSWSDTNKNERTVAKPKMRLVAVFIE